MDSFHTLFKEIESYTEMTIDYLKHSKIDKGEFWCHATSTGNTHFAD